MGIVPSSLLRGPSSCHRPWTNSLLSPTSLVLRILITGMEAADEASVALGMKRKRTVYCLVQGKAAQGQIWKGKQ